MRIYQSWTGTRWQDVAVAAFPIGVNYLRVIDRTIVGPFRWEMWDRAYIRCWFIGFGELG